MTKADDAFAEAKRLIANAKGKGAANLDLGTPKTHALTRLPEEIEYLPALRRLFLSNTQITDLTPLAKMTGLNVLYLNSTQIADLAPIAGLTGLTTLSLRNTQITDLTPLVRLTRLTWLALTNTQIAHIGPFSRLTALKWLDLTNTRTVDLTPLSGLTGMTWLDLTNTLVADLRPLRGLTALAKNPVFGGLSFKNTAATRTDAHIAALAEVEDSAIRARELFAYLENWVPPGETPTVPPKPDPIFETILIDGKLELVADLPSMAEQAEPLKKALHQRLQTSVPDLARAAGNIFPKLAAKARVLAGLIDRPFADLDLLTIHFEIELLQDRQNRGTEDDIPFSDDVLGPLSDVTRAGPGLTLGHDAVDLYLARAREARETPQPIAEEAAHRALSQAMVDDPAANGPISITMETRISALEDQAQRQAGWKAKHKWLVYSISVAGMLTTGVTVELIGQNFGPAITAFITNNAALLSEIAATYGGTFFNWFAGIMGPVFLALGVKDAIKKTKK